MIKIDLDGYFSEMLTVNNAFKYDEVFLCNTEYFLVTDGRAPTKEDCIETVEYRIDGVNEEAFHNIGFCCGEIPMACLFLIEGYPENDVLWLGLFIVHEKYKRIGFGKKCFEALVDALRKTPIKYIRLSVQGNNSSALAFWTHVGFSVIDETDCDRYTNFTMEYVI